MSYIRAEEVLPVEIIEMIQQYADGIHLYIPRKLENCLEWGQNTKAKEIYKTRNLEIYQKYMSGIHVKELANEYFLSDKSIWRIIRNMKKVN